MKTRRGELRKEGCCRGGTSSSPFEDDVFLTIDYEKDHFRRENDTVITEPRGRGKKGHGDQTEREQSRKEIQQYILPAGGSDDGDDTFYRKRDHTHDGNDEAVHKVTVYKIFGKGPC